MPYSSNQILGIDIGGSGIKGSIVDVTNGALLCERHKILTPSNAKPEELAEVFKQVVDKFNYKGIVGCGFPAVVQNGVVKTAANISKKNIGVNINEVLSKVSDCNVLVFNDADAAGYASVSFGAAKEQKGVVLFLTIGTGIGSALIIDNKLVPNTEFGHIFMQNGLISEKYASDFIRQNQELSWDEWGERLNEFLLYIESIINPELIIIGGGVSKKMDKFQHKITIKTKFIPSVYLNNAGIVGAASLAAKKS